MDSTASEDTGKKRVGATVEDGKEDKSKKVRVQTDRLVSTANAKVADLTDSHTDRKTGRTKQGSPSDNRITTVWDLESALLYLTRITESSNNEKEFLSKEDRSTWVDFRVGHAGDASTIANWYQQSSLMESSELEVKINTVQEADEEADDSADAEPSTTSSMLEVWLADGLGDEDHPPAVHALLAQVHKKSEEEGGMTIGSVALLNLTWERGERVLRVPWIQFDSTLSADLLKALEQRTWLRISLLAKMTSCQSITVEKRLTSVASDTDDKKDRPSPSAE